MMRLYCMQITRTSTNHNINADLRVAAYGSWLDLSWRRSTKGQRYVARYSKEDTSAPTVHERAMMIRFRCFRGS